MHEINYDWLVFVETRLFERLKITANDNQYLAVA